jgi:hypothetical protein
MKVFVIVREDILIGVQKGIQATHAVTELAYLHDISKWAIEHKTLVFLGLKHGFKIEEIFNSLKNKKKALFKEPDLDNQITAIAFLEEECEPITKKLNLLKG